MYKGDRSRKDTLIQYGFRLPSAFDNRPLTFPEFEKKRYQKIYVSATPGPYELGKTGGEIVEQMIRPTGLIDPEVIVRPASHQVDDLIAEIRDVVSTGYRIMVTTLTKRMSEDLTSYLEELGIKVRYLHSDIETLERVQIIRDLRLGVFDVLVGINLLREVGSNYGWMFTAYGVAGLTGPLLAGYFKDAAQGADQPAVWMAPFIIAGCVCLLGAVIMAFTTRPRSLPQQSDSSGNKLATAMS